ncbi:MAG: Methionine biosynthesis protein MetW [Candidatus Moranbacteria bacterium GW2011_GWC2_37_8]|nr:MAG: Methionine biosynthesis protein MetW [Candidatus Moranbacteria bacterium GW2011_GWC2_37_8]KKQ62561.1 MAG: Methionine biosynthesis protein MetW [Parcubacteria group bacterium GW2011_GWC1_38_22]KKQ80738.1 MAG: Methionine biosynthesis protein MetW [Candidatus Moranbacteria bacterium GW2011_GWD2_38_7]
MKQYDFNCARWGTHNLIAEEIGSRRKVLDVGCNKGYLKKLSTDNIFYGIDNDLPDLNIAKKQGYEKIFQLDLNDFEKFEIGEKFDVIIFADILEHLIYPEKVLKYFTDNFLDENGTILISLPNVANFVTRINLLTGNFNYSDSGILDRTHLHLYTLKTARQLTRNCGLTIYKEKFSSNNFGSVIKKITILGSLLGYNIILACKKKS